MILSKTLLSHLNQVYLVLDIKGTILEKSGLDLLYSDEYVKELNNIFQINPALSYMDWNKLTGSLVDLISVKNQSFYLDEDNSINNCEIIVSKDGDHIFYIILVDRPKTDQEVVNAPIIHEVNETVPTESEWNFDDDNPNQLIYLDDKGIVIKENENMKTTFGSSVLGRDINVIFLESDIGRIPEGFDFESIQNDQLVIKMIMKTGRKMIPGYSRCSKHLNEGELFYRIEFVEIEHIHVVDDSMTIAIKEINKIKKSEEERRSLLSEYSIPNFSFDQIITRSDKYKDVLVSVTQVADTSTTVLVTGETGTGKELLANAIYKLSDRADMPLIKINCANIPSELMETILFGHEKGAFTDAHTSQIGKFELADKGTIFLDEIGELPYSMQSKLLRVLQEGEIEKVGNPEAIKVDVRVIAATNRDLKAESKKGTFREDLYFRLNVFPIHSLPLRERLEDVPLLVNHFIEKYVVLTGRSNVKAIKNMDLRMLENYHFPGNVRELENIIHRGVILSNDEHLKLDFLFGSEQKEDAESMLVRPLDVVIRDHIIAALNMSAGKVSGANSASELLEVNAKTLYSKIKKYDIDLKEIADNGR